jgi:hypothetical protein
LTLWQLRLILVRSETTRNNSKRAHYIGRELTRE